MLPFRTKCSFPVQAVPLLMLCWLWLGACGPRASSIKGNLEGYDLDNPKIITLPTALNEISGLWYYPKDSSLFAIVDEVGFLYKIFPNRPDQIMRWKFAGLDDYEDVTLVGNTFYILRSDGAIYATSIPSSEDIRTIKYDAPEGGNEFESLYYDDSLRLLIMVCKDCELDNKDTLRTLGFSPETRQYVTGPFIIEAKAIAGITGQNSIKFKPSATTLNPFTGRMMMISAINSLLVTADRRGNVIQAYPLQPKLYKQPEGIAVGADRTLYISNEWAKKGSANILVIPYRVKK